MNHVNTYIEVVKLRKRLIMDLWFDAFSNNLLSQLANDTEVNHITGYNIQCQSAAVLPCVHTVTAYSTGAWWLLTKSIKKMHAILSHYMRTYVHGR